MKAETITQIVTTINEDPISNEQGIILMIIDNNRIMTAGGMQFSPEKRGVELFITQLEALKSSLIEEWKDRNLKQFFATREKGDKK